MKAASVKMRLLVAGGMVIVLALGLSGSGLTWLFKRHVERRIGAELDTYITHMASRLIFDANNKPQIDNQLADPRFGKIYSGLYWEADNETSGLSTRSRSLWDLRLELPDDLPAINKVDIHVIGGPLKTRLLVHERRLRFASKNGEQIVRLSAAIDLAELENSASEFAEDAGIILLLLGFFLLLAGWVQIRVGLDPLALVQQSIASIRSGKIRRIGHDMPCEVTPLCDEVNRLLEAQEVSIERARHRASDLAHGFKTPLTALNADIRRLREKGENRLAANIAAISVQMQRQIERELTRARIRDFNKISPCGVRPVIMALAETLKRTPQGEFKTIEILCPPSFEVRVDANDLTELLGNLMENAVKHAKDKITVKVEKKRHKARIEIDDDGDGISSPFYEIAKKRGVRLDQTAAGSGLGLAIVSDILDVYGEKLELGLSEMRGLQARFSLPL